MEAFFAFLRFKKSIRCLTVLGIERNSYARFRQKSSSGFGGEAITVKIKDGCRRPYLSTDQNHFWACTTRPLGEHLRNISKKSDQWPRRRCNNEIVTVLGTGQKNDFKDGCRSVIFVDGPESFRADTFRH